MQIRTKICCIKSIEEATLAIEAGASALGLVSSMPSGPGVITESMIRDIVRQVPDGIDTFLLTSKTEAEVIVEQHAVCGTTTIQLVDTISEDNLRRLRMALPDVSLVQVIHVIGSEVLQTAKRVENLVDMILLDSGNPGKTVKELGGTGRTHDWKVSQNLVDSVGVPVFLAGGLNPSNVGDAIRRVRPFGVDVCSGVRTNGKLDHAKLENFLLSVTMAND